MSKKLSEKKWWRNLVVASAAIALLPIHILAQDVDADAEDDDLEELEAFTMVGSRISRVDAEPISPVMSFDADKLKDTGYVSVADAIRSLPINNGQALSPTDSSISFTPGVDSMNLRGLGNNYSLSLINGRRGASYGLPGFNGLQSVFDIGSVPEAAIKSIEIETDGASAIYGSDAVAGVANFILRTDYVGFATDVTVGNYIDTDGSVMKANALYGVSTDKDDIVFAASYMKQSSVDAKDLDYTNNADNTTADIKGQHWVLDDPDAVAADGYSLQDWVDVVGTPAEAGEWDQRSASSFPGMVIAGGTIDGVDYPTYYYTSTEDTDKVTNDNIMSGYHKYNYQEDTNLFPEVSKYSMYSHLKHRINDSLYLFGEVMYTRKVTNTWAAPTPVVIGNENGLTPDESMVLPSYNAYNPFGTDITAGYRRLVDGPKRTTEAVAKATRYIAGVGGKLGGDWTWEAAALHSENLVTNRSLVVTDSRMQQALMGLTRDKDGTLSFDDSTPYDQRVYFNWFGTNDADLMDTLTEYNQVDGKNTLESVDFNVGGSVFELPAGKVGVHFGGEYREESTDVHKSYLNEKAMIVGGSEGTSYNGSRNISAFYAETIIPATSWAEIQLAGRYEKYSDDGFEDTVRPKIAVKIKPFDWLALRASYGKAFKAPDLAYLYMASSTSFTSGNINDPVTGMSSQLKILTGGNPNLDAEKTDSYFFGVVVSPTSGFLKNFTFSADYVKFETTNSLMQLSDIYGYSEFLFNAAQGDPDFVDKVIRDPNSHEILYLRDDYDNVGDSNYEALDFDATYRLETDNWGVFNAEFKATYMKTYTVNGDEQVGSRVTPEWKGNLFLSWNNKGNWSTSVNIKYIGGRDDLFGYSYTLADGGLNSDEYVYSVYDLDAQYVVNPSITYTGLWDSSITFGVNNVFNSDPPIDAKEGLGYLAGVNDGEPLFWYLRFSKEF